MIDGSLRLTALDREHCWVSERARFWTALRSTTRMNLIQLCAYVINIIRMPLGPLMLFAVAWFAYNASGRTTIGGTNVAGFLLVGMVAQICWSAAVWGGGSAIENERYEGTIAALFLSPVNRMAVVIGHGFAGLIFLLPSMAVVALLGIVTGADANISDPLAAALGLVTIVVASLAMGVLLAAFFVLTRRANLMANFIQHPINLLAGFIVPRAELPGWLHALSDTLPIAHALDAFRASTLTGASLSDIGGSAAASLLLSGAFALVGAMGIRRIEHAAKRTGQLELF